MMVTTVKNDQQRNMGVYSGVQYYSATDGAIGGNCIPEADGY